MDELDVGWANAWLCFWAWEVAYVGRMGRGQNCCSLTSEDQLTCTTAHKVSSSLLVGWRESLILRDVFKIAISDYSLAIHLLVHGFWDFIRFPVYIEDAFGCFFFFKRSGMNIYVFIHDCDSFKCIYAYHDLSIYTLQIGSFIVHQICICVFYSLYMQEKYRRHR